MRKGGSILLVAPIESEWINALIYSTDIDWTPAAPLRDFWFSSKMLKQPNTVNKEFLSIRIKLSWFLEEAALPSACCFWHRHTQENTVHRITLGRVPWLFSGPACRAFCRRHSYWVWPIWGDGPGEPSAARCQHGAWSGWATQATLVLLWPQIWAPVFDKTFHGC